jgi:hypothetical protein
MKCNFAEILIEEFTRLRVHWSSSNDHSNWSREFWRRSKLKMKRWANRAHNCKTTKLIEWDSSVTWRSTWFDWSSYLIWLNITEGKPAFYRQIPEHHTAEFQLGTIYVGSTPQMGSINPSLWGPFTPHYVVPRTPHYGGPSTPHYGAEQATTIKFILVKYAS